MRRENTLSFNGEERIFVIMSSDRLRRALSYLWPVPIRNISSATGKLQVRWENGHKVLNSKHGNQSFGSLHEVWRRTFKTIELADRNFNSVLLLGLGGGSVIHIIRDELKMEIPITVIEIDPIMFRLAKDEFGLNTYKHITVIQGDAIVQLHSLKKRYDLIVIDLFNDLDMARGVETNGFAHALRDRCTDGGLICFNTVSHSVQSAARCERVHTELKKVFNKVDEYQFEGMNRVFVGS
ncbi:MAG: fused MFS/spermidine synthase [Bacteroidota bacterium]|nr:fused MFS/spermidine synthase [Bacteroidota bacterium]